jgi:hypothetical protein
VRLLKCGSTTHSPAAAQLNKAGHVSSGGLNQPWQPTLSPSPRAPALFLQIASEFATIGSMFSPSLPIRLDAEDKLAALRRLDKVRAWNSLDDQLYCTVCKNVISGRQIEVVGGTNGLRALRLKCSTPGCFSTPADWILPVRSDTIREIDILFRDDGV